MPVLKKSKGKITSTAAGKRDRAAISMRRAQTLLWSENTTFDLVLLKIHPEIVSILFNHLNITSAGRPRPSRSAITNQPTTEGGSQREGIYFGFRFLGRFG